MHVSDPVPDPSAALIAIDSCGDRCSVALSVSDEAEIYVESRAMRRGHAEFLLPMVDTLIQKAGVSMDVLAGVAVTCGPGSFAGVRVGIAAARGLALALGIPAAGFSVLEVLGFAARERAGDYPCLVTIAARGDELYMQAFDEQGHSQSEPRVTDRETCLARYRSWSHLLAGSGAASLAPHMRNAQVAEDPPELVSPLLRLARTADATVWHSAPTPLYLRPPDAELSKRPGLRRLGDR